MVEINLVNIRDFSTNRHHTVDDTPYGGGAGMLMAPEAIFGAVEAVNRNNPGAPGRVVLMCPQGTPFSQALARTWQSPKVWSSSVGIMRVWTNVCARHS